MSCERTREKIPDLIAGHLPEAECEALERHIVECDVCSQFRESVAEFYSLDLGAVRTRVRVRPVAATTSRSWSRRAIAASVLPLLFLLGVLTVSLSENRPALGMSQLPRVEIDWPNLPAREFPAGWLASAEVGRVYSQYTGMPMLESHIFPQCPRCKFIERVIGDPLVEPKFDGFVRVRTTVDRKAAGPGWVTTRVPREKEWFQLPAMRITDGECATEPQFSIGSLNQIVDLMGEFEKQCADERSALGAEDYQRIHDAFGRVRSALEDERFDDAHRELDAVIAIGDSFRTAFVDRAREIDAAIETQLAEVAQFLEDALENDRYSPSSIRLVARRIAERAETLSVHAALARVAQ